MTTAVDIDNGDVGGVQEALDRATWAQNGLVYPPGGWNGSVEVFSVAAGETKDIQIDLGASCTYVQQPTCTTHINPHQAPGVSCYSVVGNDDLPIVPKQWRDYGGRILVKLNDDTTTATLTLIGPNIPELSPFQIAASSGAGIYYSTLRLVGNGIGYEKKVLTYLTGLPKDKIQQDALTIDNEFIQSETSAKELAVRALGKALGGYQTISVTSTGINRLGDSGVYDPLKMHALNDLLAGATTMAEADALIATWGSTAKEVDAYLDDQVVSRYENQAFGNVAGSRVLADGCWYRIRSVTFGPESLQYTAEMDMLCSDFDEGYAGMSVAEFNALNEDALVREFDAGPVPLGALGDE